MKLYFVRHGHTNYNRFGIMNDDPSVDVHLTSKGLKQAKSASEQLKDTPLTHIYVSQLPRTRQTAEIINSHHNLKIEEDSHLNDNRTGFNGKPWIFMTLAYLFSKDRYSKRFNDGESLLDSKKRVTKFLAELKSRHDETDEVLIVGHSNTGQIITGYFNNYSNLDTFTSVVKNGKVLEFDL